MPIQSLKSLMSALCTGITFSHWITGYECGFNNDKCPHLLLGCQFWYYIHKSIIVYENSILYGHHTVSVGSCCLPFSRLVGVEGNRKAGPAVCYMCHDMTVNVL